MKMGQPERSAAAAMAVAGRIGDAAEARTPEIPYEHLLCDAADCAGETPYLFLQDAWAWAIFVSLLPLLFE